MSELVPQTSEGQEGALPSAKDVQDKIVAYAMFCQKINRSSFLSGTEWVELGIIAQQEYDELFEQLEAEKLDLTIASSDDYDDPLIVWKVTQNRMSYHKKRAISKGEVFTGTPIKSIGGSVCVYDTSNGKNWWDPGAEFVKLYVGAHQPEFKIVDVVKREC